MGSVELGTCAHVQIVVMDKVQHGVDVLRVRVSDWPRWQSVAVVGVVRVVYLSNPSV